MARNRRTDRQRNQRQAQPLQDQVLLLAGLPVLLGGARGVGNQRAPGAPPKTALLRCGVVIKRRVDDVRIGLVR